MDYPAVEPRPHELVSFGAFPCAVSVISPEAWEGEVAPPRKTRGERLEAEGAREGRFAWFAASANRALVYAEVRGVGQELAVGKVQAS